MDGFFSLRQKRNKKFYFSFSNCPSNYHAFVRFVNYIILKSTELFHKCLANVAVFSPGGFSFLFILEEKMFWWNWGQKFKASCDHLVVDVDATLFLASTEQKQKK